MSTVPDQERRTRYSPTVGTLNFPVGFVIYDNDDVAVFHDGVEIDTALWSVTASYVKGESTDAAVVVTSSDGWANVVVDIVGRRRPNRVDQYADGAGIPASAQNLVLNEIVAAQREAYNALLRTLQAPPGEVISGIPSAAARAGLVLAFDANGNPEVSDLIGSKGWSPAYAIVSDSARRVYQLVGYVGGEGTAPTANIGNYVGATGYVTLIASAVDIRGAQGASGAGTGDMVAANNLSDVADAPTARTNLGLGNSATKAVGTGSTQVAAGDHLHDSRYYTQAQVDAAIAAAVAAITPVYASRYSDYKTTSSALTVEDSGLVATPNTTVGYTYSPTSAPAASQIARVLEAYAPSITAKKNSAEFELEWWGLIQAVVSKVSTNGPGSIALTAMALFIDAESTPREWLPISETVAASIPGGTPGNSSSAFVVIAPRKFRFTLADTSPHTIKVRFYLTVTAGTNAVNVAVAGLNVLRRTMVIREAA